MSNTAIIPFHNSALRCVEVDGVVYVAAKPICEHIGFSWQGQSEKLASDSRFNCQDILVVAEDGKKRKMTCLPQHQLLGWLYTINANRVKPEARDLLLAYQTETTDAINNYWADGVAVNPRMQQQPTSPLALSRALLESLEQQEARVCRLEQVQQQAAERFATIDYRFDSLPITGEQTGPIKRAVRELAQKMGGQPQHFRRAWSALYDRYDIAAYRDLPRNHYEEALEFIGGLTRAYSEPKGQRSLWEDGE